MGPAQRRATGKEDLAAPVVDPHLKAAAIGPEQRVRRNIPLYRPL